MTTPIPAQIRDSLTEQQQALLAKLDELSPDQLGQVLSYLLDGPAVRVRTRATYCSCGRPAREVLDGGEHGPTGYCGVPGVPPLDECDCGHHSRHDRSVCHIYGAGGTS